MNVFIIQHTGATNKGAEALFRGALQLIQEACGPQTRIRSVTSQVAYDSALFPEVEFFSRQHVTPKRQRLVRGLAACPGWLTAPAAWGKRSRQFWLLDRAYRTADVVLSIGGDMFTDHYGLDGLANELWYVAEAVRRNKIICLLGQSIGPLGPAANCQQALQVLQQANLITIRETASWRYLEGVGLPMQHVARAGDLSLLMRVDAQRDTKLTRFLKGGAPKVGVNVSQAIADFAGAAGERSRYIRATVAGIRLLWQTHPDAVVYLVPHVMDRQANDDRIACAEVAEQLADARVVNLPADAVAGATAMELKYFVSQMDVFVAARTHATLAAYTTGVPAVAIAYSLKAKGLAEHYYGDQWQNYVLEVKSMQAEELARAILRTIEHRGELSRLLVEKTVPLRAAAQHNVELVRQALAQKGG